MFKILVLLLVVMCSFEASKIPGLQMRLTEHGMKYAVDVGIKIMKEDLIKKTINEKGQAGKVSYEVRNLKISQADFGSYQLVPVAGTGMRGKISGITIKAAGDIWYRYKKGWFKISDTIGVSLKAYNIYADLLLSVGADTTGHPTIDLMQCNAGVNDIDLDFHGGGSWLYNLFSSVIEKQLKKSFGTLLCKMAAEEINTRAKSELATFPVIKKLDDYAVIDYSLTQSPQFTANYMDAFLKGEFKARNKLVESKLPVQPFTSSSTSDHMLYFWLSDYTLNTAGEVYHNTGFLKGNFEAWDKSTPSGVKTALNTKNFGIVLPKLYAKFPNAPMALDAYTYKPPTVHIVKDKLILKMYAHTMFSVMDTNGKVIKLFGAKFDISATLEAGSDGDNITAKIDSFDYNAQVNKEYLPEIDAKSVPLDSPMMKIIIDMTVISKTNPVLKRGFPLPKIDEVALQNFKISFIEHAIQVGTDVKYVKSK